LIVLGITKIREFLTPNCCPGQEKPVLFFRRGSAEKPSQKRKVHKINVPAGAGTCE
jgi:hypothetical protein